MMTSSIDLACRREGCSRTLSLEDVRSSPASPVGSTVLDSRGSRAVPDRTALASRLKARVKPGTGGARACVVRVCVAGSPRLANVWLGTQPREEYCRALADTSATAPLPDM